MVQHRIIQYSITGLINDADSEALLINMLVAVSALWPLSHFQDTVLFPAVQLPQAVLVSDVM